MGHFVILAVAENYPELKASQNFAAQDELSDTENKIQAADASLMAMCVIIISNAGIPQQCDRRGVWVWCDEIL